MEDPPSPEAGALGDRSVAAGAISGIVVTGDHAAIDARTVRVAAGPIPRPDQVPVTASVSNLPRPPARVFAGRDAALAQLSSALAHKASAVVTQTVYGLGGVGKSELALQHAHAHRADYQLVWWITAADAKQIKTGLAELAARLCPEIAGTPQNAAAGWALGWLQAHGGWLLVLDNMDDLGDVQPLLAQLSGGHIVLTSRRDVDWQRLAAPVRLDVLDPGPAAEVIIERTGHTTEADRDDAAAVAAELGYLPLALDQAAAYITRARITPGAYLAKLRQHPARMYAAGAGEAQRTVARLWDITIKAVHGQDPDAVRLLQVLACYAPDNIPRIILGGADPSADIDGQLGLLASYSLITLTTQTVSIHRLVQAVIIGQQQEATTRGVSPAETALDWLHQATPNFRSSTTTWPLLSALVPHIDHLTTHYLSGGDHRDVAIGLRTLAIIYMSLEWPANALPLFERALQITETALGPSDFEVAVAMDDVAVTYRALGRNADALPLFERALQITETALGPGDFEVAVALRNLAFTYRALGRNADALPLFERALQITETALGPGDPWVPVMLADVVFTYKALGRDADARRLKRRRRRINNPKGRGD